jgi:uncharacterized membrane protein YfcA
MPPGPRATPRPDRPIVRALLVSPLGFLIGLSLGALGGGGSILAVPVLVYAAGQEPRAATTTSLLVVGLAALAALPSHHRAGRVHVGTGVAFGAVGIGGSLAGSALNHRLDPDVLLLLFAGLVLVAAWRMLTSCPTCTRVGESIALARRNDGGGTTATLVRTRVDTRTIVLVALAGTAVGFLTGLFGVGGGFVIVPALALVLKLPMPQAIGTSILVIAINAAVALAERLASSGMEWEIAVPFAIAAMAGSVTGGRVADRLDATRSLRAFAGLLVAVAVYTAVSAATSL